MRAPGSDLPVAVEGAALRVRGGEGGRGPKLHLAGGALPRLPGPNGAGKSPLLLLAMGLGAPTSGRVVWGGRGAPGERLAMMFQRPLMLRPTPAANGAYALPAR